MDLKTIPAVLFGSMKAELLKPVKENLDLLNQMKLQDDGARRRISPI